MSGLEERTVNVSQHTKALTASLSVGDAFLEELDVDYNAHCNNDVASNHIATNPLEGAIPSPLVRNEVKQ